MYFSGQLFCPNGTLAKVHSIEDDVALASGLTKELGACSWLGWKEFAYLWRMTGTQ
jgi:hypothetical protein